jgi:sterol 3beta-glucosyltransferase
MTYTIIDYLMWLGTKGIINSFRRKQLGLKPVGLLDPGSSLIHQNKVPFGYIWSPSLVPKPKGGFMITYRLDLLFKRFFDLC